MGIALLCLIAVWFWLPTEIYVPSIEGFVKGPTMSEGRIYESAVSFNDGTVLIAGGKTPGSSDLVQQGLIYKLLLPVN